MTYPAYEQYKDSGIPWLRQVPETWDVRKLQHTTYVKARIGWQNLRSEEFTEQGPFCVTGTDFFEGRVNWKTAYHVTKERYDIDPNIQLKQGDLLITKDGTIGKLALIDLLPDLATLNSGVFVTRPLRHEYENTFMFWIMSSQVFTDFIKYMNTGTTINHLYQHMLYRFLFPMPSVEEQKAIAAFLDRKTAEIDALIGKKEALLTLLEEKRTATITHAVTKGLNPAAPLKPSGIPWLGDIPEHWDLTGIKNSLIQPITDGPHETPEILTEGIPFVSAEAIKNDKIDFNRIRGFISEEDHARFSKKYIPQRGDVYMVKSGATTGNVARVETDEEFNIWSPLAAMRPDPQKMTTDYLFYFIKSKPFFTSVELSWSMGTQQNIGMGVISNIRIAVPPLDEQEAISKYLEENLSKMDAAKDKITAAIERLREYRTALITHAVTGKIKVV